MIGRDSIPVAARIGVWSAWLTCSAGLVADSSALVTGGVVVLLAVPLLLLVTLLGESVRRGSRGVALAVGVLLISLALSVGLKLVGLA